LERRKIAIRHESAAAYGRLTETTGLSQWRDSCIAAGVLDPIAGRIEHYMDLLSARQKLVASNVANIDTPGYQTRDIDFQFEFQSLMQGGQPNVIEPKGLVTKNDGNNVALDREARLLAENAIRFNFASNLMRSQLRMLRSAIEEKTP
jgi:flagellar basal-body rod protein FlgB